VIKLARILQINTANVVLKLENDTQCLDCKSRCSDGFLRFLFNRNKQGQIIVDNTGTQFKIGHLFDEKGFFNGAQEIDDIIGMKFNEKQLLNLSLVLYGLPILILVFALIIGYFVFNWLGLNQDLGGIFGFLLGLFLSKFIIKLNASRLRPKVGFFK
jgi:positive regulator of sigma E activity